MRGAARKDSKLKFTALLHHLSEDLLTGSFFGLKKTAAVGVDGVTWREYEQGLEARIACLHGRFHRGSYRAKPSKRAWIPKADGRKRPIGIAALEDKIVQHAVSEVLRRIHEVDFPGFSYGFRVGRSQHDALDALSVGITSRKVNWILDADIEGFFDALDHEWMLKFPDRIGDREWGQASRINIAIARVPNNRHFILLARGVGRSIRGRGAGFRGRARRESSPAAALLELALELQDSGVRVIALAPGAIRTPINQDVWQDPENMADLKKKIPIGRIGEPEEIARIARLLVSDEASYVTGVTIMVDGGMTAYPSFSQGG